MSVNSFSELAIDLITGESTVETADIGQISIFSAVYLGNGYRKYTVQFIPEVSDEVHFRIVPNYDTPSSCFIGGVQIEKGDSATSYIPTTGAAVTRASDQLTYANGHVVTDKGWAIGVSLIPLMSAPLGGQTLPWGGAYRSSYRTGDAAVYSFTAAPTSWYWNAPIDQFQYKKPNRGVYSVKQDGDKIRGMAASDSKLMSDILDSTVQTIEPRTGTLNVGFHGAIRVNALYSWIKGFSSALTEEEMMALSSKNFEDC
jgi:hypothetical protein